MAAIGIDTHKATLAACHVDELGTVLADVHTRKGSVPPWAGGTLATLKR